MKKPDYSQHPDRAEYMALEEHVAPVLKTIQFALGKAAANCRVVTHFTLNPMDFDRIKRSAELYAVVFTADNPLGGGAKEAAMIRILGFACWADATVKEGDIQAHYSRFMATPADIEEAFEFAQPDGTILRMTRAEVQAEMSNNPEFKAAADAAGLKV